MVENETKGKKGLDFVAFYSFDSPSESLYRPTSLSSSATTSSGLVTCHLASVRFDGGPMAVVKMVSGLSCSSTRGCLRAFPSPTSETDSGGSMAYGKGPSVNCKARNMSSSVYCGAGNVSRTDRELRAQRDGTLSSPAQKTNWASGFRYKMRLTISPLLIAVGRTSRFFLPTRTTKILSDLKFFSIRM